MNKILTNDLFRTLKACGIEFFTGVPDSVLKETNSYFNKKKRGQHIIAANEGGAVSIATGYYLTTNKIPLVYMQNSGLSNAVNPLASITHRKVYSIPMLLLIGWRGSPKSRDEPQHMVKGNITTKILKLLNISYCVLKKKKDLLKIIKLVKLSKKQSAPVACLVEKNVIKSSKTGKVKKEIHDSNSREKFIYQILKNIKKNTRIISTTGYTSRELYQIRQKYKFSNGIDFYVVGGMGHASSIALGASLSSKKNILCLDGDGSLIMHMGSLGIASFFAKKNFKYILFNNSCHESVGRQKTIGDKINFKYLCKGLGFRNYFFCKKIINFKGKLELFIKKKGPSFFEIRIPPKSMVDLKRPKNLIDIKKKFMKV